MNPNMMKLMQQAKTMQEKMEAEQARIANKEVIGEAGAGLVKITLNGRHDAKKAEIDPSVVEGLSSEDKEILEDLICAAINDASRKIDAETKNTLSGLTAGMNLPNMGSLFN